MSNPPIKTGPNHPPDFSGIKSNVQVIAGKQKKPNVTSVYDTLPINAIGFFKNGGNWSVDGTDFIETGYFEIQIPVGRLAVVKKVNFSFDTIFVESTISTCLTRITVNNMPLEFFDNIVKLQDGIIETFFIAPELSTVKVTTVRTSNIILADRGLLVNPTYYAEFKGDLLLSKNLPPAFAVGSIT